MAVRDVIISIWDNVKYFMVGKGSLKGVPDKSGTPFVVI
jgi:hypothetical protein